MATSESFMMLMLCCFGYFSKRTPSCVEIGENRKGNKAFKKEKRANISLIQKILLSLQLPSEQGCLYN
jgi:hypothetical protein